MVYFKTKNTNLGKFWSALDWKMLIHLMAIWNTLRTWGIFYDHLVHFVFLWCIFKVLVSSTKKNLATLPQRPLLRAAVLCRKMPVIPGIKMVDEKRILGKRGLRRRRAWGC
jgi:hypothetical protein